MIILCSKCKEDIDPEELRVHTTPCQVCNSSDHSTCEH